MKLSHAMKEFEIDRRRRTLLTGAGYGLGAAALGHLWPGSAHAASRPRGWSGVLTEADFPVRAKRVIHLCMAGGPSQFETLDWKPILRKLHGQPFPASLTKGQQLAQLQNTPLIARGSFVDFKRYGKSGQEISTLLPHIGSVADDICIIRSMYGEQINHDPAHAFMNTGSILKNRPSMGSWLLYGLGAESQDLPGFVVMVSVGRDGDQPISSRQWSAGFLPSRFQGIQFQSKGDAVHFAKRPDGVSKGAQERITQTVRELDAATFAARLDPEIETRISQYEMAFRMQTSVPELTDLSSEPKSVLAAYGIERPGDGSFASNCLMARRLAERGVRFIQLYHRAWDHHGDIEKHLPRVAQGVDQPCAALIKDLKQRGMLDDTLVIWGGEFGRTPMGQGSGRDHHINAFSIWMAGGGVKGGMSWGHTDEMGYNHLKDGQEVAVRDLHATMLRLCGVDHNRLTFPYQGLDQRLTGVEEARVVKEIIS
ncbi:MAG: DUF1501 domain-containing protein [Deltaproteobacteria bacterium]|nr:DUF1501 domain-containing protein [Deltaproteobacteria bacterium]